MLSFDLGLLLRHLEPTAAPRIVREAPDQLGYTLTREPLLSVMSRDEWADLERSALERRAA